jgi:hypothetical protein
MSTFRKFWEKKPRADYYEFFNDFMRPTDYDTNDWTLTTIEAGAGSATEAIGNLAGGVLVITNDAADDDYDFFSLAKETFKYVSGKAFEFEARFKVSDATQSEFIMGLAITDTTPLDASDGIFFIKEDGEKTFDLKVVKNSTASTLAGDATTNPTLQVADDTYIKVGFYYDGVDANKIQCFINDVRVGALPLTNVPDDEELAITFGLKNGEAVAKIMSVDYIRLIAQR